MTQGQNDNFDYVKMSDSECQDHRNTKRQTADQNNAFVTYTTRRDYYPKYVFKNAIGLIKKKNKEKGKRDRKSNRQKREQAIHSTGRQMLMNI